MRTESAGRISRGTPIVSKSLSWLPAPAKSLTSMAAHVAHESGLVRDAHANRWQLLRLGREARKSFEAFGRRGAARELFDHLLRKRGWRAAPRVRQQIDEKLLGRGHGIEFDLAREREAYGLAVGIAPGGAEIARRLHGDALDGDSYRLGEVNDQHIAGDLRARLDLFA
jgi:hypothetical protein